MLSVGLCMDNGIHYFFNTDSPDPLRVFVGRVPRHSLGFTTTRNKSGQLWFYDYTEKGWTSEFMTRESSDALSVLLASSST